MTCVLRIYGKDLDVDDLLAGTSVACDSVFRKGHRLGNSPRMKPYERSGISIVVSEAGFDDLERQIAEVIAWLEVNRQALAKAVAWPGVDAAGLDFGIHMRNVYSQCDYFPASLVRLAGALGLGIELSQYPPPRRPGRYLKAHRRILSKRVFPKAR